jgi:hypothetical protein
MVKMTLKGGVAMSSQRVMSLLVLEYEQLKEEQRARIGTRDNLVYLTIGTLALIVGAVVQSGSSRFLLLIPPVCITLGWTYLVNDDRVSAIGSYLRDVLGPEVTRLSAAEVELFGWERRHREEPGRRVRKAYQLAVELLLFCGTAVTALTVASTGQVVSLFLYAMMFLEFVAVVALATRFVARAR